MILSRLMLAEIAGMVEAVGLQIGAPSVGISGNAASARISSVMSSTERSAISWMKLMLLYSPDAMRETTSRRVISGSTTASRPRRP